MLGFERGSICIHLGAVCQSFSPRSRAYMLYLFEIVLSIFINYCQGKCGTLAVYWNGNVSLLLEKTCPNDCIRSITGNIKIKFIACDK